MDREEYGGETKWWEVSDYFSSADEILAYQADVLTSILEELDGGGGDGGQAGTIIGDDDLQDAASVTDIPVGPTSFEQDETEEDVEISPGGREKVVAVDLEDSALWYEVGSSDKTYSEYQYIVDGAGLMDQPQVEPLGLYNDPYRFPQPIIVRDKFYVTVKRNVDAPGPADYFSKVRYIPIRDETAEAIQQTWRGI